MLDLMLKALELAPSEGAVSSRSGGQLISDIVLRAVELASSAGAASSRSGGRLAPETLMKAVEVATSEAGVSSHSGGQLLSDIVLKAVELATSEGAASSQSGGRFVSDIVLKAMELATSDSGSSSRSGGRIAADIMFQALELETSDSASSARSGGQIAADVMFQALELATSDGTGTSHVGGHAASDLLFKAVDVAPSDGAATSRSGGQIASDLVFQALELVSSEDAGSSHTGGPASSKLALRAVELASSEGAGSSRSGGQIASELVLQAMELASSDGAGSSLSGMRAAAGLVLQAVDVAASDSAGTSHSGGQSVSKAVLQPACDTLSVRSAVMSVSASGVPAHDAAKRVTGQLVDRVLAAQPRKLGAENGDEAPDSGDAPNEEGEEGADKERPESQASREPSVLDESATSKEAAAGGPLRGAARASGAASSLSCGSSTPGTTRALATGAIAGAVAAALELQTSPTGTEDGRTISGVAATSRGTPPALDAALLAGGQDLVSEGACSSIPSGAGGLFVAGVVGRALAGAPSSLGTRTLSAAATPVPDAALRIAAANGIARDMNMDATSTSSEGRAISASSSAIRGVPEASHAMGQLLGRVLAEHSKVKHHAEAEGEEQAPDCGDAAGEEGEEGADKERPESQASDEAQALKEDAAAVMVKPSKVVADGTADLGLLPGVRADSELHMSDDTGATAMALSTGFLMLSPVGFAATEVVSEAWSSCDTPLAAPRIEERAAARPRGATGTASSASPTLLDTVAGSGMGALAASALLKQALDNASRLERERAPEDFGVAGMRGMGTALGDPIEALGAGLPEPAPCEAEDPEAPDLLAAGEVLFEAEDRNVPVDDFSVGAADSPVPPCGPEEAPELPRTEEGVADEDDRNVPMDDFADVALGQASYGLGKAAGSPEPPCTQEEVPEEHDRNVPADDFPQEVELEAASAEAAGESGLASAPEPQAAPENAAERPFSALSLSLVGSYSQPSDLDAEFRFREHTGAAELRLVGDASPASLLWGEGAEAAPGAVTVPQGRPPWAVEEEEGPPPPPQEPAVNLAAADEDAEKEVPQEEASVWLQALAKEREALNRIQVPEPVARQPKQDDRSLALPSVAADDGDAGVRVEFVLKLVNVDYSRLLRNPDLLRAFASVARSTIAEEAKHGITEEHVQLSLSAGSVVIHVSLRPPKGVKADALCSELSDSPEVRKKLEAALLAVEGLDEAQTGPAYLTMEQPPAVARSSGLETLRTGKASAAGLLTGLPILPGVFTEPLPEVPGLPQFAPILPQEPRPGGAEARAAGGAAPRPARRLLLQYHGGAQLNAVVGAHVSVEPVIEGLPREGVHTLFSVAPALPAGLHLDASTGVLTGAPEQAVGTAAYEVALRGWPRGWAAEGPATLEAQALLLLRVCAPQRPATRQRSRGERTALAAADVQRAFRAVESDNYQELLALTEAGTLQKHHVNSKDIVDAKGRTLSEAAQECGNRRVLNFFRNGLIVGPSFYAEKLPEKERSPAYLTPLGMELPADAPPTPGYGIDPRSFRGGDTSRSIKPTLECTVTYPELPKVLRVNQWYSFAPHVSTKAAPKVEASSVLSSLRFGVTPALPAGLKLCERTGLIQGTMREEFKKESYEVKVHVGGNRHGKPCEAACRLEIQAALPPAGLSYPRVEKVVEISDFEWNRTLPPVPPASQRVPLSARESRGAAPPALVGGASAHLVRALIQVPTFQAAPRVKEGTVDFYEITPALPRGMQLDRNTGVISGIPEHRFPAVFRHTFEVFAHNGAGLSACKVWIEVLGGKWNIAHVTLQSLGDAGMAPLGIMPLSARTESRGTATTSAPSNDLSSAESEDATGGGGPQAPSPAKVGAPAAAPWLARACPVLPTAEFDWGSVVDKVAIVLEKFGKFVRLDEPGGVAGIKMVRGMAAAALVPLIGLTDDAHTVRRLLRAIETRGHLVRDHPPHGHGGASRGEVLVCVSAEDAMCAGDALIYLRRGPGLPQASPRGLAEDAGTVQAATVQVEAWDHTIGKWPHPSGRDVLVGGRLATSGSRSLEPMPSAHKVNTEFSKLLPSWRAKLQDCRPQVRQDTFEKWRGPILPL